jgi:S-adenosylmethionine:tRNA ribosyltransferase-isomerase
VATPTSIDHTTFGHLDRYLRAGDVLVINTSATVPGQLDARRGNAAVVVHIANRLPDGNRVVELRTAPDAAAPILDARPGESIDLTDGGTVALLEPYPHAGSSPTGRGNRLWRARLAVGMPVLDYLCRHARPISYGYLRDRFPLQSYQTVFALHPGSAEMPSAGRPFTPSLVTKLVARGVTFAPITLHTSVSSTEAGEGPLAEWFEVSPQSARLINE